MTPEPRLVDKSMNQWNHLVRVPLTYNFRHGVRRLAEIIYPERVSDFSIFSWSLTKPLDPSRVRRDVVELPRLAPIKVIRGLSQWPRLGTARLRGRSIGVLGTVGSA